MSDNERTRQPHGRQNDAGAESGDRGRTATDGGAAVVPEEESEPDDGEGDDGPSPAEVVENVAGTSASVPDADEMGAAIERGGTAQASGEGESDGEGAAGPAGISEQSTGREPETRVLEFTLAGERYCLDIEYIEEIVKQEAITRVPNTPEFVEGVVDLRGQITTILNPKVALGKDDSAAGNLIVVFDPEAFDDQGHIGWVVDDVRQVSPVAENQVNDPPMGESYINGVIDREGDGQFVIWTTPDLALEEAE